LNPGTGSITAQYHVFFDDWFTTVSSSPKDLPLLSSPKWDQIFSNSEYQYPVDDAELDDAVVDPTTPDTFADQLQSLNPYELEDSPYHQREPSSTVISGEPHDNPLLQVRPSATGRESASASNASAQQEAESAIIFYIFHISLLHKTPHNTPLYSLKVLNDVIPSLFNLMDISQENL
jgi:hypothetical protein